MDGCYAYLSVQDRELTSGPLSIHGIGSDLPGYLEAGMVACPDDIFNAVVSSVSPLYT
jgi:hypothetical protein